MTHSNDVCCDEAVNLQKRIKYEEMVKEVNSRTFYSNLEGLDLDAGEEID